MEQPAFILLTLELLDVLPFSTLYGAFGILLYLWIAIVYPIYLVYRLTCGRRRVRDKTTNIKDRSKPAAKKGRLNQWISEKVNTVVFALYGESDEKLTAFLKKESTHGVSESRDAWTDTELPWLATMVRINAITLLLTCGLALWDRFLILRTTTCDDTKICFWGTNDPVTGWSRTLITNCSSLNSNQTGQVICFEFAYNAGDAVGLAGGVLTYGIYSMKFGSIVLIFFFRLLKKCCKKTVYRLMAFVVQQLPITAMLVAAILSMAFARYRDLVIYGTFVEAFGIASIMALVLATPWSVLVTEEDAATNIRDELLNLDKSITKGLSDTKVGKVCQAFDEVLVGSNSDNEEQNDHSIDHTGRAEEKSITETAMNDGGDQQVEKVVPNESVTAVDLEPHLNTEDKNHEIEVRV